MQVFELHFNPPGKGPSAKNAGLETSRLFDSFCYQPENIYEKRLGGLYILGELKNATPKNSRFLKRISQLIKEKYYSNYLKSTEGALKESLRSLNDFLSQELKRDNTEWMGGLSLAILSLAPQSPPWANLNLALSGDIKILLLREGQVFDIGKKLEGQEIEPYPLKVFSNIVSGKIYETDTIASFTKDASEAFQAEGLILKMAKEKELNDKKIKAILKPSKEELIKSSGICLLIRAQSEVRPKSIISFEKKLESFSLPKTIKHFSVGLFQRLTDLKNALGNFIKNPKKMPAINSGVLPKIVILILILVFLLAGGAFLNQRENRKEAQVTKNALHNIDSKISQAENLIQSKKEEEANLLLQKTLNDVSVIIKKNTPLAKIAIAQRDLIGEKLNKLNKVENVDKPSILFEFSGQKLKFTPYRMALSSEDLYFYNPLSDKIYRFEIKKNKGTLIPAKNNISLALLLQNSALFFRKPKTIFLSKDNKIQEETVDLPNFNQAAIFGSYIYFLDPNSGEIIKQSLPPKNKKKSWLASETKKVIGAKSIAIDGSIWILTKENKIDRYYRGQIKQTIDPNLFPAFQNPTKIWTNPSLPYIYCLEPQQKRLVILNKKGKVVKQYQSEKFNNLLDFAVSKGGKTIYLLNGSEVFNLPL